MTANEKLLREILDLDEGDAVRARIVIADEPAEEPEMAPLPVGWGEMLTSEPIPTSQRNSGAPASPTERAGVDAGLAVVQGH